MPTIAGFGQPGLGRKSPGPSPRNGNTLGGLSGCTAVSGDWSLKFGRRKLLRTAARLACGGLTSSLSWCTKGTFPGWPKRRAWALIV